MAATGITTKDRQNNPNAVADAIAQREKPGVLVTGATNLVKIAEYGGSAFLQSRRVRKLVFAGIFFVNPIAAVALWGGAKLYREGVRTGEQLRRGINKALGTPPPPPTGRVYGQLKAHQSLQETNLDLRNKVAELEARLDHLAEEPGGLKENWHPFTEREPVGARAQAQEARRAVEDRAPRPADRGRDDDRGAIWASGPEERLGEARDHHLLRQDKPEVVKPAERDVVPQLRKVAATTEINYGIIARRAQAGRNDKALLASAWQSMLATDQKLGTGAADKLFGADLEKALAIDSAKGGAPTLTANQRVLAESIVKFANVAERTDGDKVVLDASGAAYVAIGRDALAKSGQLKDPSMNALDADMRGYGLDKGSRDLLWGASHAMRGLEAESAIAKVEKAFAPAPAAARSQSIGHNTGQGI